MIRFSRLAVGAFEAGPDSTDKIATNLRAKRHISESCLSIQLHSPGSILRDRDIAQHESPVDGERFLGRAKARSRLRHQGC